MYTDPYQVLEVDPNASLDDVKKAYRRLSRIYHPDANVNNPNAAEAEEKFKQIQAAYQQILDEKEHGTSYGHGSSQGTYGPGSSRGYYGSYNSGQGQYSGYGQYNGNGQYYEQDQYSGQGAGGQYGFGKEFDDFFNSFFGGQASQSGSYSGNGQNSGRGYTYSSNPDTDNYLKAATNYINSRHYQEALNVLNQMNDRPAHWYYLSAFTHKALGNMVTALEHATQAVSMDGSNYQYRALLDQLRYGSQQYQTRGQQYSGTACSTNHFCLDMLLLNLACNCCCNGAMGGFRF